jgi:hypothetical protein
VPTSLDDGRRSPRKLLSDVIARLARREKHASHEPEFPFEPAPLGPLRTQRSYEINGQDFSTLDEFYEEVERVFTPDQPVRNLDDFNSMLYAEWYGLNHRGFTFRWKNHELSREKLGYPETVRWLQLRLQRCHPTNRARVGQELASAEAHQGPTAFDWLVDVIRSHGPGGEHEEDNVKLVLA